MPVYLRTGHGPPYGSASFLPMPLPDFVKWVKPTDLREMPRIRSRADPRRVGSHGSRPRPYGGISGFLGRPWTSVSTTSRSTPTRSACRGRSAPTSVQGRRWTHRHASGDETQMRHSLRTIPTRWTRTRSSSPAMVRQRRWPMRLRSTGISALAVSASVGPFVYEGLRHGSRPCRGFRMAPEGASSRCVLDELRRLPSCTVSL